MTTINYTGRNGGPFLLMSFIKNWKNAIGETSYTWIKCHIWFATIDELNQFVDSHQEIKGYIPPKFDKNNFESWPDFYTMKVKFDK